MKKIKKLLLIRVNRVIHFVVKNVKTCHLISVTSKCNPKLFFQMRVGYLEIWISWQLKNVFKLCKDKSIIEKLVLIKDFQMSMFLVSFIQCTIFISIRLDQKICVNLQNILNNWKIIWFIGNIIRAI